MKTTLIVTVTSLLIFFAGTSIAAHPLDDIYRKEIADVAAKTEATILLRRMSLQLRGEIPAAGEVLSLKESDLDQNLWATRYIQSPEFAEYWGDYFASLFRARTKEKGSIYASYENYFIQSIHSNKPYAQLAQELITSEGSPVENPAVNFYLRDDGDPLQIAEYTGRVFLGKRLACARCHDHPDEDFSRRDYYAFAAFFSQNWIQKRTKYDFPDKERQEFLPADAKKELEQKRREWYNSVWNPMSPSQRKTWQKKNALSAWQVAYEPAFSIRFPYSDDEPGGDLVEARFPWGKTPYIAAGEDRRKIFADWLTSPSNDRFRKVIINRIWTKLMGWSFFPVPDNMPVSKKEIDHNPILNHLDEFFVQHNTQIKDLVYYIVTSDAYARRAPSSIKENDPAKYFQPVRLDASQLFNSLVKGSGVQNVSYVYERSNSSFPNLSGKGQLRLPKEKNRDYTRAIEIEKPVSSRAFPFIFGAGKREDVADDVQENTLDQVLTMLNGNMSRRMISSIEKKDSYYASLYAKNKNVTTLTENLYLGLLGRKPDQAERKYIGLYTDNPYLGRSNNTSYPGDLLADIAWGILNSEEFLHVY